VVEDELLELGLPHSHLVGFAGAVDDGEEPAVVGRGQALSAFEHQTEQNPVSRLEALEPTTPT
jgi:hypothetical protein